MEFVYRSSDLDASADLEQGDLIEKNQAVVDVLQQAHGYYASAVDYTHFVVITQTCDLVRRGGNINAPYITIAAVRPIKVALKKFLMNDISAAGGTKLNVAKKSLERRLKDYLERLLHNTEDDVFFFPADGHPKIPEDLCGFLQLSIALRVEHYDTLLNSRVSQLSDIFQAKLGWMKGNLYSRVATPALEEERPDAENYKRSFFKQYIEMQECVWLGEFQNREFKKLVKDIPDHTPEMEKLARVTEILKKLPSDNQIVAQDILDLLVKNKIIDDKNFELQARARTVISNVPAIKSISAR